MKLKTINFCKCFCDLPRLDFFLFLYFIGRRACDFLTDSYTVVLHNNQGQSGCIVTNNTSMRTTMDWLETQFQKNKNKSLKKLLSGVRMVGRTSCGCCVYVQNDRGGSEKYPHLSLPNIQVTSDNSGRPIAPAATVKGIRLKNV